MGAGAKKRKAQENAANQQASAATTALQKAGVDTTGLSRDNLVAQYNNGYSMISEINSQTANDYFSKSGTGSGSAMESSAKESTMLSGFMPFKKKTLLGGYLGSNTVLGG